MAFRAPIKVCFSDIDYAGIMYYPRFLHYFHVALEELFGAELGIDYSKLLIEHRIGFPTVQVKADFSKPISYGDKIEVEVTVRKIGRTSIIWRYRVYKPGAAETVVAQGQNATVTVNLDTYEKMETPDWLKQRLADYKRRSKEQPS